VQITVHDHARLGRRKHVINPVAPKRDSTALIRPNPSPEPLAQGVCRGRLQTRRLKLTDRALNPLPRRFLMQLTQKLRKLPTCPIPVDRVNDLEQRGSRHEPGHQQQRIGAARNDLRQERNRRLLCQRGQYGDLVRDPKSSGP
jgi:hypothetical protein